MQVKYVEIRAFGDCFMQIQEKNNKIYDVTFKYKQKKFLCTCPKFRIHKDCQHVRLLKKYIIIARTSWQIIAEHFREEGIRAEIEYADKIVEISDGKIKVYEINIPLGVD